jgi:plasmid maintenance system antidote protein VapI
MPQPSAAEEQLRTQVRSALIHAEISQAEAARRLGLSNKHVNQMITGRAPLTLFWAERILALCGVRVIVGFRYDDGD